MGVKNLLPRYTSSCILQRDDDHNDVTDRTYWSDRQENLLVEIMDTSDKLVGTHHRNHISSQRAMFVLTIPTILIPLVCSICNIYLPEDPSVSWYISGAMICSSIATTLIGTLNPGKLSKEHLECCKKYTILSQDINYTLSRDRAFRGSAELAIERFSSSLRYIRGTAPRTY